jgi:hypothetical protein
MTRFSPCFCLGLLLSASVIASPVSADVVNGGFENFFAGWTTSGPNTAASNVAGVLPTEGRRMAYLSNGSGSLPLFVQSFIVDSNLGLPAGTVTTLLSSFWPTTTEGAVLFQTFTLDSNQNALSFDWNLLTNEVATGQPNNDYGVYGLFDSSGGLVSVSAQEVLSSTFVPTPSGAPFSDQTGWSTVSISGLTPGDSYSLVFGVFDVGSTSTNTGLLIDNIQAVPEPSSAMLLGLAALPLIAGRRRTR